MRNTSYQIWVQYPGQSPTKLGTVEAAGRTDALAGYVTDTYSDALAAAVIVNDGLVQFSFIDDDHKPLFTLSAVENMVAAS